MTAKGTGAYTAAKTPRAIRQIVSSLASNEEAFVGAALFEQHEGVEIGLAAIGERVVFMLFLKKMFCILIHER